MALSEHCSKCEKPWYCDLYDTCMWADDDDDEEEEEEDDEEEGAVCDKEQVPC